MKTRLASPAARRRPSQFYGVVALILAALLIALGLVIGFQRINQQRDPFDPWRGGDAGEMPESYLPLEGPGPGRPGSSESSARPSGPAAGAARVAPEPPPEPSTIPGRRTPLTVAAFDLGSQVLLGRHGGRVYERDGRWALRLPEHDDRGQKVHRLLLADEKGIVFKAGPSSAVVVDYQTRGTDLVTAYLLGTMAGMKVSHRLWRGKPDTGPGWQRLTIPLCAVGVLPGEDLYDVTLFFRSAGEAAETFVADVSVLKDATTGAVLFDLLGRHIATGEGWRRDAQAVHTARYGMSAEVPYNLPEGKAALVVALFGRSPSSATVEAGGLTYQLTLPEDVDGRASAMRFAGPRQGTLVIRLYPAEGAQMGLHRVLFYRVP